MSERSDKRAMPCPMCRYDLRGNIIAGRFVCPECGWRFNELDVQNLFVAPDARGEPRSLRPDERRMRGRAASLLVGAIIVSLLLLSYLFAGLIRLIS